MGSAANIPYNVSILSEEPFINKKSQFLAELDGNKLPSKLRRSLLSFCRPSALVVCSLFLFFALPYFNFATLQIGNCSKLIGRDGRSRQVVAELQPSDWALLGRTHYTERILEQILRNGSTLCHNVTTRRTEIVGLPDDRPVRIPTDQIFLFKLVSFAEDGKARCAGGDYYEVDLEGDHWKGRPEVTDLEDGSYEVRVMVDGQKAGLYNFTARLLFSNMHGLDHDTLEWRRDGEVAAMVEFLAEIPESGQAATAVSSEMKRCTREEMMTAGGGGGRWTRGGFNASCTANQVDGRWQCLSEENAGCESPWCDGEVAALESNGWVYSDRRCSFHIFTAEEAWQCLSGRWLFMWGDSNMLDFLRNLLIFGLEYPPPSWANISTWEMNRVVEQALFVNPQRPDQALRVSYVFNGHYKTSGDWLGLDSLLEPAYRDSLRLFFNGSEGHPDTFVFNSGLHDGLHFATVADFAAAVGRAAEFWAGIFRPLTAAAGKRLRFLLRTTVAPAGQARWNKSNPHKMEVFNAIFLEGFRKRLKGMHVIDAFDTTFPFHYDFSCSDGGHYGRPPGVRRWPWFDKPHHYFVEVMLVHMMLNSICTEPTGSTTSTKLKL